MIVDRRFALRWGLTTMAFAGIRLNQHSLLSARDTKASSIAIGTWPFAMAACKKTRRSLESGDPIEAIVAGISVTESDLTNQSVGAGGLPNAAGRLQLDACIMNGTTHKAGAVAALVGFAHPIDVARKVMLNTKHVLLVGEDASAFANKHGCEELKGLTPESEKAWQEWLATQEGENAQQELKHEVPNHDTIALLLRTEDGEFFGGCSTSGLAFKTPGRVGDSPIIGSGLYVDSSAGAAGATGIGENILRYCGSFLAVEFMRQGLGPTEACKKVIERIANGENRPPSELSVNFIAISKDGEYGAAGTDDGFQFAVDSNNQSEVITPEIVRS